jgi:hypothetical protein
MPAKASKLERPTLAIQIRLRPRAYTPSYPAARTAPARRSTTSSALQTRLTPWRRAGPPFRGNNRSSGPARCARVGVLFELPVRAGSPAGCFFGAFYSLLPACGFCCGLLVRGALFRAACLRVLFRAACSWRSVSGCLFTGSVSGCMVVAFCLALLVCGIRLGVSVCAFWFRAPRPPAARRCGFASPECARLASGAVFLLSQRSQQFRPGGPLGLGEPAVGSRRAGGRNGGRT